MPKEKVVVSLGGSVLVPGEGDAEYIKALAARLRVLASTLRLFLVTGGGRVARYYIEAGRALGVEERELDALGIEITRLNARLLIAALRPEAAPEVPVAYPEALAAAEKHALVVMGGQRVGITTDGVAAELAEAAGASRLVNATIVDGVYTADPSVNPGATRLSRMTYDDLLAVAGAPTGKAGPSMVFDPYAAQVAKRARIPLYVVQGRDLNSLEAAIQGRTDFVGTTVGETA